MYSMPECLSNKLELNNKQIFLCFTAKKKRKEKKEDE